MKTKLNKADGSFKKWFVEQFGPRNSNSCHPYSKLTDEQLRSKIISGQAAQNLLDYRRQWDREYDTAERVWCARDSNVT